MSSGHLILLTLPIGNLGDLTPRVHRVLEGETNSLFLCEDTRQFKTLMGHLGLDSKDKDVVSFHDHDRSATEKTMASLKRGQNVYLVSDAGSPVVSDPAYPLIQEVLREGYEVSTYPGVNSLIPALELSGLPPHPFTFHGFLPREDKKRRELFHEVIRSGKTHIFFEAPHRLEKSLEILSLCEGASEVDVAVARELTKKFETVYRFKAGEYPSKQGEMMFKGECVLLLYSPGVEAEERGIEAQKLKKLAQDCLDRGGHPKALAKLLGEVFQQNSKEIYTQLVKNSKSSKDG